MLFLSRPIAETPQSSSSGEEGASSSAGHVIGGLVLGLLVTVVFLLAAAVAVTAASCTRRRRRQDYYGLRYFHPRRSCLVRRLNTVLGYFTMLSFSFTDLDLLLVGPTVQ